MTIYIHEFSTGIQAEERADGGWVSKGFTGQYMNKTIDPIPRVVQEAISNRDFAVAEGASSEEPAFIGREMAGYEEEWSVIAVVTRGRDDRGRSASVYRYFLSEGSGNLGKILSWLNARKQAGQDIIFAPFDTQILGEPHEYSESEPDLALRPELKDLLESSPPIIIPSDSPCAPLIVNTMAQEIANGQPIAWAYNVEALEEPRGFQVIQPASSRAEDLLKKAIASKPNSPAPVSGEKAIISAINGLVKRDRVKPEQVETIENALSNPQIDDSYWESIFKGRGTDKALKQGIYSADMVRLLTLRATVIPETLPEFLAWIGKEGKQQESKQVSDTFQAEIKKSLRQVSGQGMNLINRVCRGVRLIIPRLIKQPKLLDSVVWLLSSDKGLWGYFYSRQVKSEIDNDLRSMRYYGRGKQGVNFKLAGYKEWQKIFNEIQVYWQYRSGSQAQYQPLAELFSRLRNYQLAALFYYICSGVVPKEVFYKLTRRGFHIQVYGIRAKREIGSLESLYLKTVEIGGLIMPVYLVAFLMAVTIPASFFGGNYITGLIAARASSPDNEKTPENNSLQSQIKSLQTKIKKLEEKEKKVTKSINSIIDTVKTKKSQNPDKALKCDLAYEISFITEKYPQELCSEVNLDTQKSIKKIIDDFVVHMKKDKNGVENKIVEIFNEVDKSPDITIAKIIQNNKQGTELIKKYQKDVVKSDSPDGKINNGQNTFKVLKCHVAEKLDIKKDLNNDLSFKIKKEDKNCKDFNFNTQKQP